MSCHWLSQATSHSGLDPDSSMYQLPPPNYRHPFAFYYNDIHRIFIEVTGF